MLLLAMSTFWSVLKIMTVWGEHNLHYAICTNAILIQFVLCNFIYTACTNANHVICTSIFNSYNLH